MRRYAKQRRGSRYHLFVECPLAEPIPRSNSAQAAPSDPKEYSGARVLVVDDDAFIRESLATLFTREGMEVVTVGNARGLDRELYKRSFDLLILDLMLPGEDGMSIAKRLKKVDGMPIVMLSAKGSDDDRIAGLEIGADDYLPKPFNPRELLARMAAVLRRSRQSTSLEQDRVHMFGPFELNMRTKELCKNGEFVSLTSADIELLALFVTEPFRVLDREFIYTRLTGCHQMPAGRNVDVRVTRLRSKIEDNPNDPSYIKTVWGKGYMFRPDA
ncbi:MAG: response regulator [Pseudomonadales bacterium]|nr:response regulator [Pseudomonadales bacterium]